MLYFGNNAQSQELIFTRPLKWAKVLESAKQQNKYVFVDCYTTWCGPCKLMDKNVYPDSAVVQFFNSRFISVKMQMDKSPKDDEYIKGLYPDAEYFEKEYKINSYPTYLFFSPNGELVSKEGGYKKADELIMLAKTALAPGKSYDDPFAEYNRLLSEYQSGMKDYSKLPYMVQKAAEAQQWDIRNALYFDYKSHLLSLPKDSLYTKQNLFFISKTIQTSKNAFFEVIFPNGKRSDRIMQNPHFSSAILDEIIEKEIIDSLIGKTYGHAGGPGDDLLRTDITPAIVEPDWQHVYNVIKLKYNHAVAQRNVLNAKCKWYLSNFDQWGRQWMSSYVEKINKYGYDVTDDGQAMMLNGVAWRIFLNSNDRFQLKSAAKWMQNVCMKHPDWLPCMDTYANLLYKLGKSKEALNCEEKALRNAILVDDANNIKAFKNIIKAMKSGIRTWIKNDSLVSQPL
jgi:thioredoxin-related protein